MRVDEVFKGDPGDIAAAWRVAGEWVGRTHLSGAHMDGVVADDVQPVVSELVTNAVKRAGGPCGLELRSVDGTVESTVWDTSDRGVTVRDPDPLRVGRHGPAIVRKLCHDFAVTVTPSGKRITARMAMRPSAV